MDFAYPSSSFPVQPDGSNRVCDSLSHRTLSGTPCCRLTETTVPKHSINPAITGQNGDDLIDVLSSTPTVLLSGQIGPLVRKRAAALHIRSVLPLDVTSDQLLAAIQATVAGLAVTLEPFVQTEDAYAASNTANEIGLTGRLAEHLTARETVVLRLMALGLGNKEIASRLDISEHTAKFHVSSILAKLGAASRTEAVTIGMTRGLVAI
jgi:DNA-binding NarL/FixJ family response regulator